MFDFGKLNKNNGFFPIFADLEGGLFWTNMCLFVDTCVQKSIMWLPAVIDWKLQLEF